MKTFTKQQQVEHCRQLADFLETLPPDRYHHACYATVNACGTTACALGWAGVQRIGDLWFNEKNEQFYRAAYMGGYGPMGACTPQCAAADVFGDGSYDRIFADYGSLAMPYRIEAAQQALTEAEHSDWTSASCEPRLRNDYDRRVSIQALRNWAVKLEQES